MRKIGLFNIGKLGLVKSAGTGKTDISKVIEKWIPKHMVFWYDVQKQGATNEILKANPYLQDFSGNNRPLKLNNFLFAAMSGVGGYDIASTNILPDRANVTVTDNRIIHITKKLSTTDNMVNIVPANSNPTHKFKITGLSDGRQVSLVNRNGGFYTFDNGEHEVTLTYPEGTTSLYNAIGVTGDIGDMDVTIEFIPRYPNALVTDGVDDYGQIQNLQHGVKVLFVTINPFIDGKFIYDQRLNTTEPWLFAVFNDKGSIAYNSRNSNGKTYIDGTLNESTIVSALLNKKQIITIVNNDVTGDKTKTPIFFSNTDHNSGWISSAFYNSFGFDSVPTKQNDGFTEQDLIDYYIPKAIVTITVVDVSGSPIQDATVTVEGVQYKTLSDGTVKVRGMANGTMSLSVKKDGYMPFSDNSWKFADSRITLEVLRNTVITENGYSILLENDGLILTE